MRSSRRPLSTACRIVLRRLTVCAAVVLPTVTLRQQTLRTQSHSRQNYVKCADKSPRPRAVTLQSELHRDLPSGRCNPSRTLRSESPADARENQPGPGTAIRVGHLAGPPAAGHVVPAVRAVGGEREGPCAGTSKATASSHPGFGHGGVGGGGSMSVGPRRSAGGLVRAVSFSSVSFITLQFRIFHRGSPRRQGIAAVRDERYGSSLPFITHEECGGGSPRRQGVAAVGSRWRRWPFRGCRARLSLSPRHG